MSLFAGQISADRAIKIMQEYVVLYKNELVNCESKSTQGKLRCKRLEGQIIGLKTALAIMEGNIT